jgi:SAM-dependent methyltransferase
MSSNDFDLRYLQRTPAGAEYVTQINAKDSDRRVRSAFRDRVLGIAPPSSALFDFGAGPGIDARFFAERGFTVDAYDVDPRMREYFANHCRDLMDAGHITLDCSTYREFVTRPQADSARRVDLVVSNFAPLNIVDNLSELFEKFHALTHPQGKVLASVLNPYFIGDMRFRAWWRGAPRLWRDGQLFMPGPQAPHYRRLVGHFRTVSARHFQLSRIFGGFRCRYMFLLFEKTDR